MTTELISEEISHALHHAVNGTPVGNIQHFTFVGSSEERVAALGILADALKQENTSSYSIIIGQWQERYKEWTNFLQDILDASPYNQAHILPYNEDFGYQQTVDLFREEIGRRHANGDKKTIVVLNDADQFFTQYFRYSSDLTQIRSREIQFRHSFEGSLGVGCPMTQLVFLANEPIDLNPDYAFFGRTYSDYLSNESQQRSLKPRREALGVRPAGQDAAP